MTGSLTPTPPAAVTRLHTPFGAFDVRADEVVSFPSGLPGFEDCRRFVVVSAPDVAPMQCLHALDGPATSFLVMDPRQVIPSYRTALSQTDLMRLGAEDAGALLWLAVVSIDHEGHAYVNLRAPIVINPERMLGYQVMPHNSLYPLRHPLASE